MIYSIWLCIVKNLKNYSKGIIILLIILQISDFVTGSSKIKILNQNNNGYSKESVETKTSFCDNDNLNSLLYFKPLNPHSSSRLSSNRKPSNQNKSTSSTTSVVLPQGNENIKSYFKPTNVTQSVNRIDGYENNPLNHLVGCIDPRSYNWKFANLPFNESGSLSGVQIFLFHVYNNHNLAINVDIRILIDSSQEVALVRPIVIVLSSFLPRKFFLSAISFLFNSRQPIHIILTHPECELIIKDEQLSSIKMYLKNIFISVLNLSKEGIFLPNDKMNGNEIIDLVYRRFRNTTLYKYGYFFGSDYNSVMSRQSTKIWLFNDRNVQKVDMKIVSVYIVQEAATLIDLILGKTIPEQEQSDIDSPATICQNIEALKYVIKTYTKIKYFSDVQLTCSYYTKSSPVAVQTKYRNITWLHIKSVTNFSLDIHFISNYKNVGGLETYLLILTGNEIVNSIIKFQSYSLNKVHILTNISMNQLDAAALRKPTLSIQSVTNLSDPAFQSRIIASHISAASPASVILTTMYQFHSGPIYEIRLDIDDSKSPISIISKCLSYSKRLVSIYISINLNKWRLNDMWAESEFFLGNNNCKFQKKNNSILEITRNSTECSFQHVKNQYFNNKIYRFWRGKKYQVDIDLNIDCRTQTKNNKKQPIKTTPSPPIYIPKDENFYIFNNSKLKSGAPNSPFYENSVMYIQLYGKMVDDIFPDIQLRDCFITNRRATKMDFQINETQKTLKKVTIVHEGCFNSSSDWYSNVHEQMRPKNHTQLNNYKNYLFSVLIAAEYWAPKLSLEKQWNNEGKYQVHLYCGINECNSDKIPCRNQAGQCSNTLLTNNIDIKYFGSITIVRQHENIIWKIMILVILIVIIFVLSCLIFFCLLPSCRHKDSQHQVINKFADQEQIINSEVSFFGSRKKPANLNYHSLTLLTKSDKKSSMKLYSEPKIFASLKHAVENCDKSLCLQAGYLTAPVVSNQLQLMVATVQSVSGTKNVQVQSQSLSDFNTPEPTLSNWVINSWPLSTAEQKSKSQGRNNIYRHNFRFSNIAKCKTNKPSSSWYQNTNSSGDSSKQKISYTLNSEIKSSDPKASSNRTTVSESLSTNDMPNKLTSKWWSLLTNYWMNQSVAVSRN